MLPKRSAPVARDPRHVVVQVRVPKTGLSFPVLASRVSETQVALATFVDLDAGQDVILDMVLEDGAPPLVLQGVVEQPRDDEGSVLVTISSVDDLAKVRLAAWVRAAEARAADDAPLARSS